MTCESPISQNPLQIRMAMPRDTLLDTFTSTTKPFHTYWIFLYAYDHTIFKKTELQPNKIYLFPLSIYTKHPQLLTVIHTQTQCDFSKVDVKQRLYKTLGISNIKKFSEMVLDSKTSILCIRIGFGFRSAPIGYKQRTPILFFTNHASPMEYLSGNHMLDPNDDFVMIPTNEILLEPVQGHLEGVGAISCGKTYVELLTFLCETQFQELFHSVKANMDTIEEPQSNAICALKQYKQQREDAERAAEEARMEAEAQQDDQQESQ